MKSFTKQQAIVITGYTGVLAGSFSDFHEDVENRLRRPVFTHEFASKDLKEELKRLYKDDFISMCYQ